jgi:Phage tail lysozyme
MCRRRRWQEIYDKSGEVYKVNEDVMQKYLDNQATLLQSLKNEFARFDEHAMKSVNDWFEKLQLVGKDQEGHYISDFLIKGFDEFDKRLTQDYDDLVKFFTLLKEIEQWGDMVVQKWRPDLAEKREKAAHEKSTEPTFAQQPLKTQDEKDAEELRRQQEKNRILEEIRNALTDMTGGEGAGGTSGVRRPGGPMQAGGGGFRPSRGTRERSSAAVGPGGPVGPASGALAERIAAAKAAFADQLRQEGVPEANIEEAANLLAGQGLAESGLNPRTVHDRGTGYGIYGARLERRTAMLAWMKEHGYPPDSLEGQARYMAHEAMSSRYPRTREALTSAEPGTRQQRTNTITREFEAPAVINPRTNLVTQAADVAAKAAAAAANREAIDKQVKQGSIWEKGTAAVTVDFGDAKIRAKDSKEGGEVFKKLQLDRPPQSAKSGSEGTGASFSDRWYFQ